MNADGTGRLLGEGDRAAEEALRDRDSLGHPTRTAATSSRPWKKAPCRPFLDPLRSERKARIQVKPTTDDFTEKLANATVYEKTTKVRVRYAEEGEFVATMLQGGR